MIKSMTGFAKAEVECETGKITGEARALNSRYLEINLKLPKIDYLYEQKLRELAKKHIKRGKIDITMKWERISGEWSTPKINEIAVRQYLDLVNVLKNVYGLKGDLTIENILTFRDILSYEENNNISVDNLVQSFEDLLKKLNEERTKEGRLIQKDLKERLKKIMNNLSEIEGRWPLTIKVHEEKLKEKMIEVTKSTSIDEIRVLQELAIYMERLDIAEEIMRLKGHIENFKSTLSSPDAVGRKLDFIIQEMVREANTIGSKSNDLYINERVVQIKVEIEKMREQAQNVE
ncbi:MAG: YicC family protein [Proteobacteria bacterium]|nr:YicC family protein [Pseudomonadota bacterium]